MTGGLVKVYKDASRTLVDGVAPDNPMPVAVVTSGGISTEGLLSSAGAIGANGASVAMADLGGRDTVLIDVSGTFVATLSVDVMLPGGAWRTLTGTSVITDYISGAKINSATITAPGLYQIGVTGLQGIRVRASAYTSGSAAVILAASNGNSEIALDQPVILGANQTVLAAAPVFTPFALETTAVVVLQSVKTSAGTLYGMTASNPTATPAYLKLYNKASAPVVASDTPIRTISLPAGADVNVIFTPKRFSAGIAYAVTGAAVKTDATAAPAGVQIAGDYI